MTLKELWEKPIESKWAPVVIEGKQVKNWAVRDKMLMQLDAVLCPYGCSGGRNAFNVAVREEADMPGSFNGRDADLMSAIIGVSSEKVMNAYFKVHEKEQNAWTSWWGANPYSGDGSVFKVSVIDSSYCGGCMSFFNPFNGKIPPTVRNVGKWPGSVDSMREEIEWFAKEFPEVDLYITFGDEVFDEDKKKYNTVSIGTIRLYGGSITIEETRHYKDMNKLPNFCGGKVRKVFNGIKARISVFYHRYIQSLFSENKYVYWHNYCLLNSDYSSTRVMKEDEIMQKVHWWKDVVSEKKVRFQEYLRDYLSEGKKDVMSADCFVYYVSDGSICPEIGNGRYVYKNGSKKNIDFPSLYDKCNEVCARYNSDCLCDLSDKDFEDACKEVVDWIQDFTDEYGNRFDKVEWYWK